MTPFDSITSRPPNVSAPSLSTAQKLVMWGYRVALLLLLFGVSSLTYGSNALSPTLTQLSNLAGLVGATCLFLGYFDYPPSYKAIAWIISLSVFGLVLESLYIYNQYMYSFFVIKRFTYPGLALLTLVIARRAGPLKLSWVMLIVGALYFYGQIVLGKILEYGMTSESRTTSAYEALYLILPLLFFLMRYVERHRLLDLMGVLFTFGLIVFLLHRSVISSAVFALLAVGGLSLMGRLGERRFPVSRTVSTLLVLGILIIPFLGALSPAKTAAFLENIGGITKPTEDNTGNWRYEQSLYYWSKIPERLWLGWRYEGYDRGEVMVNEDFPEKGTIIHSQYIDMLYNYGLLGTLLNLYIILITLWVMYRRNRRFTAEQAVLFGFIASGLLFGVSYQLPIYYWSYVGLGMFYGLKKTGKPALRLTTIDITEPPFTASVLTRRPVTGAQPSFHNL